MNKKVVSVFVLLMFVFLVGCLDYKAYEAPAGEVESEGDIDLLNEIAAIEAELNLEEELGKEVLPDDSEVVVEEIVLPELEEEVATFDALTISVDENELVKLNVKVSDPDGDEVSYTFTPPIDNKGEWKTNYGDAGEYMVTLKANDGLLTTERVIKIVVNRVNVPPVITGIKDISVKEGAEVIFSPSVSDPNGDEVTTTVSEPLSLGKFKTDHTSSGEYEITVVASDGELSTEETFLLSIADVNVLPEISNLADINVKEGEVVKIEPLISDLDEDEITLTISEPVGDDGVWQTSFTDHGTYNIKITANDGKDTVNKNVKVVVEDVNMPPEIIEISLQTN
jgi:hypothetical protein